MDDEGIVLQKFGEFFYDNLIIFAPEADAFGSGLIVKDISHFVSNGKNLLIAAGRVTGELVRTLANEFSLDFDEQNSLVLDHFSFDAENDKTLGQHLHSVILVNGQNDPIGLFNESSKPLLFSGIAQVF